MKAIRVIISVIFSLYLLVGVYYNIYGEYSCEYDSVEAIRMAVWHFSREILTLFFAVYIFLTTYDIKLKKICAAVSAFNFLQLIFDILNIFGVVTVSGGVWGGFSVLVIFAIALILFSNE